MPATIQMNNGDTLTVRGLRWKSVDRPDLAEVLNESLEQGLVRYRQAYRPDLDLAEAERVAQLVGAKITHHEPVNTGRIQPPNGIQPVY